ncbi:MAG TPA: hypothetical protein VI728_08030 [Syntrophales bacterium]|nr:hypothetical protein [Syntrophales bacterium]
MGYLRGQTVEGKGGNKADDTMGGYLGNIDEIDFRRDIVHFGKLIDTPGK